MSSIPVSDSPASSIKVTTVEPCAESKIRIVIEMIVDAHCLAEAGSRMLSAAARGVARTKK